MGIAVKTLLDDTPAQESLQARAERKAKFPDTFVPFSTHFAEDLDIAYALFEALCEGVQSLDAAKEPSAKVVAKSTWETARKYLELRR